MCGDIAGGGLGWVWYALMWVGKVKRGSRRMEAARWLLSDLYVVKSTLRRSLVGGWGWLAGWRGGGRLEDGLLLVMFELADHFNWEGEVENV